jgi:hypothetical protein
MPGTGARKVLIPRALCCTSVGICRFNPALENLAESQIELAKIVV